MYCSFCCYLAFQTLSKQFTLQDIAKSDVSQIISLSINFPKKSIAYILLVDSFIVE